MTTDQGADERRVRSLLRTRGVGPDALPPQPTRRPSVTMPPADWWDQLYADTADTHPGGVRTVPDKARIGGGLIQHWRKGPVVDLRGPDPDKADEAPDEDEPDGKADPGWEEERGPDESTPAAVKRSRNSPGRRVQAEFGGLERRMQWLLSTGAGAGIGWFLGLEHLFAGWIADCARDNSTSTGLIFGVGLVLTCGYASHRTRGCWPPLAWTCRIPFATALLALDLYAPGVTS